MKTCSDLIEVKLSSPIGPYIIKSCKKGLHYINLAPEVTNENFLKLGDSEVRVIHAQDMDHQQVPCILNWFKNYFEKRKLSEIDICEEIASLESGKFRQKVWITLREQIGFGEKVSYGQLAKLSGSPGANQAVGTAMSSNQISLVIPCHRVVKSDGSIGNYSKATRNSIKEWLLDFESEKYRK